MDIQPELSKDPKASVSFGCLSCPSTMLTIAIIAIRAFQHNAEPMSQWSCGSWFLMCLPLVLPAIAWVALILLTALGAIVFGASGK